MVWDVDNEESCVCVSLQSSRYRRTLYFLLSFSVNLKLLLKSSLSKAKQSKRMTIVVKIVKPWAKLSNFSSHVKIGLYALMMIG